MKKYFILLFLFSAFICAQSQTQRSCVFVHNTSTNPLNPINTEFIDFVQNPSSLVTVNSFLNTGFNWYNNPFDAIYIGKSPEWQANITQLHQGPINGTYQMLWPWHEQMPNYASYLYRYYDYNHTPAEPDIIPEPERDFRWEDGWELLWLNLGYLPNGDDLDNLPPGSWIPNGSALAKPYPNHIPYFVLYNRYTGLIRLFANVWDEDGGRTSFNNLLVSFSHPKNQLTGQVEGITGLLRLANGKDRFLSDSTDTYKIVSPRVQLGGTSQWLVAEYQTTYDPCICDLQRRLEFVFEPYNEITLEGIMRGITVDRDIKSYSDTAGTFLNLSDVDGNYNPGTHVYPMMGALFSDYKKRLNQYNQDLNDYNAPLNTVKKGLVNIIETGLGNGLPLAIPLAPEAVKNFVKKNQLKVFGYGYPDEEEAKKWAEELKKSTKKILADEYEFLNIALGIQEKPTKPQVPVASYTESSFRATITDAQRPVYTPSLIVPGTKTQVSSITPSSYPAYNNSLGVFAILKRPTFKIGSISELGEFNTAYTINEVRTALQYVYDYTTYAEVNRNTEVLLQFEEGIEYVLNPALDYDLDKTKILVSVQIEFEKEIVNPNRSFNAIIAEGSMSRIIHAIPQDLPNNKQVVTYTMGTDYYDIKDIKNLLLSIPFNERMEYEEDRLWHTNMTQENERFWEVFSNQANMDGYRNAVPDGKIKSIKLKIAADFYFNQVGYNDEQVNTFQVYTYNLFSASEQATKEQIENRLISMGNDFVPTENLDTWKKYHPISIQIKGTIDPSYQLINEQIGNDLYIRAEEILVTGELNVAVGYNLFLEAINSVTLSSNPEAKLGQRITARINNSVYQLPKNNSVPVDDNLLNGFCNDFYNANVLTNKALLRAEEQHQRSLHHEQTGLSIRIYPNPTTNYVQVSVQNQPQDVAMLQFALFDITGRQVMQTEQEANSQGQYTLQLPQLSGGIYMLHIKAGQQTSVEKVVVR